MDLTSSPSLDSVPNFSTQFDGPLSIFNKGGIPSNIDSEQLERCLILNRELQDNLRARLHSIENAKLVNVKQQKRLAQLTKSTNFNGLKYKGEMDMLGEQNNLIGRTKLVIPPLLTGDEVEDNRLKQIAGFDYFPYFIEDEQVPLDNLDTLHKHKNPPLIKSARRWGLREKSLLAAGVRQENIRLKIEEILKKAYGQGSFEDKGDIDPSKEIWEVRKLPDQTLELNLNQLNWEKISHTVPGRSAKECAIRWTCYDHPLINKSEWTESEEIKLVSIAKKHSQRNWPSIATELGTGRTAIQCFHQFQTKLNHQLTRKRWTKEEDIILKEAVKVYGERNWQQIAQCLDNRTGQQCLHRWAKALNPTIKRGRWTPEEDEVLKAAVAKYGAQSWVKIQPHVQGRTDVQCRERWMNVLHPDIDDSFWNPYEDAMLLTLVNNIGIGKWSSISQKMTKRTDNQCWRRWKRLMNIGAVNGDLIADPEVLKSFTIPPSKNKKKKVRDEDESDLSETETRYRNLNPRPSLKRNNNNIDEQEEEVKVLKKPIGGGISLRKSTIDSSWAMIDQRISVHLDTGKPLPPVLGSLKLYETILEKINLNDTNFTNSIPPNQLHHNQFNINYRDWIKFKDTFKSLFLWPHISGNLSIKPVTKLEDDRLKVNDFLEMALNNLYKNK